MSSLLSAFKKTINRPGAYYLLVVVLGFIPLFYNLGAPVLNHWDESRRAVNAYEMMQDGHLLVTCFNGEPEMWGTKPPLLIWLQVLSFKVFGASEFALRFPVALSGMLLALLLLWFCGRYFKDHLLGLVSVLILYTTPAMVSVHSARTGDFDMVLILFTTAAAFFMLLAVQVEDKRERDRWILLFFAAFTLAALTKGIAPFLLAPGLLAYLLVSKSLLTWLRSRNFWIGTAMLVLLFGGYYLVRELLNPGYLRAVVENEMTGRYFETLEENQASFDFYIRGIHQWRFKAWFYLVPLGVILGYWKGDKRTTGFLNLSLLVTSLYLLVISLSETKLEWYDLPVFPFLFMMAALFFQLVIQGLTGEQGPVRIGWGRNLVAASLLLFFFMTPYYHTFKSNRSGDAFNQDETYRLSHYLRELHDRGGEGGTIHIIHLGENAQQFLFYVYLLEEDGYDITISDPSGMSSGNTYLLHQPGVVEKLKAAYPEMKPVRLSEGIYSIAF